MSLRLDILDLLEIQSLGTWQLGEQLDSLTHNDASFTKKCPVIQKLNLQLEQLEKLEQLEQLKQIVCNHAKTGTLNAVEINIKTTSKNINREKIVNCGVCNNLVNKYYCTRSVQKKRDVITQASMRRITRSMLTEM